MRVVVQQLNSDLFVGEGGAWVQDAEQARDFRRTADAILYCVHEHLSDVRVSMLFGAASLDVHFYPFRNQATWERTQTLQETNEELKAIQSDLVQQVKDAVADIAEQAKELPLRRKKKREQPPPEDC